MAAFKSEQTNVCQTFTPDLLQQWDKQAVQFVLQTSNRIEVIACRIEIFQKSEHVSAICNRLPCIVI